MAIVEITGAAWDHNRVAVPNNLQPELWFRPLATSLAAGLLTSREVKAEMTNGNFTVSLESHPSVFYVPYMRWLSDTSQANLEPEKRALEYCEWPMINAGQGGSLSNIPEAVGLTGVFYGMGDPPLNIQKLDSVLYLDITGPGVGVWGPEGATRQVGVVV